MKKRLFSSGCFFFIVFLFSCQLGNSTYTVTYDGNGNTGGSVPIDPYQYETGQTVAVLGNTGALLKTSCAFEGWNTRADGTGVSYIQGQAFAIGKADVTLYAQWRYILGSIGPAGGWVFYDKGSYSDGWRYLEAAASDQGLSIYWRNNETDTLTNATGVALGTGKANTTLIVANQGEGTYAAKLCYDLVIGSYDDWFLPSLDELNYMYLNLRVPGVGGLRAGYYWSSSETSLQEAWAFHMGGSATDWPKYEQFDVRAIRTF